MGAAVADPEDAALQQREELLAMQAEIRQAKAELEAIRKQASQALNVKQLSSAEQAKQKAIRGLAKKRAAHLKAQVDWARAGKKGMPPNYLTPLTNMVDFSAAPTNPDGSSVVPEGKCAVWVSCYDLNGRDDSEPQEVRRRISEGYEIAKYEDKSEVRLAGLGVLMYCDPEAAAIWSERRMVKGAVNPTDYFAADLEQEMELENRGPGERKVNVYRSKEHGERKRFESMISEEEAEEADDLYS